MAKVSKNKNAVSKRAGGAAEAASGERTLSPWRAWENEIEHLFADLSPFRWGQWRGLGESKDKLGRLLAPSLDVYDEKKDVVVKAELPGLTKDDVQVTLSDSTVTIKGEKKREKEVKEKDFYRSEREYGSFLRTVPLPAAVNADQVVANFKDGVLEIRLPKSDTPRAKPTRVAIK